MKKTIFLILLPVFVFWAFKTEKETGFVKVETPVEVEFPSLDGIMISAHVYEVNQDAPVILLCHQARFNKYEYADIAPKLNALGFNCVAIDQRSGGELRKHQNITHNNAVKQKKPTRYLDAEQDIKAAIDFVFQKYHKPLILWGSSYSSTLALYLASESDQVSAVISFSPGNYFANQKGSLIDKLAGLSKPMFVTSSKKEAPGISKLLQKMKLNSFQTQFIPSGKGYHGSKALWVGQEGGAEYWEAVKSFLQKIK